MPAGNTRRDGRRRRKALSLAIGLVAITFVARVGLVEATEDPAGLTYQPAWHDFSGSTQYTSVNNTGDVRNTSAVPNYSYSLHNQVILQSLSYGITDSLRLSLALAHSYLDSRYEFGSMGSSSTRSSEGAALIALNYRLLNQASQPFNLDLTVANTGGSTTISYEAENFAILARAGVYRARGGTGLDAIQNVEITIHETWRYETGVRSQFRLSPRWFIDLGATYTSSPFIGSSDASIAGSSFQLKRPDALSVGLAATYRIVPDRLSVQLGYQHIFIGQRRDEYADSTRDVVASNQRANSLNIALIYRF
ncbi:MAG TPA: hypothetical protein VI653_02255 [Steroidobacteraceae bacterium]